ncbi:acyltransferase family protein [Ensifer soli]|uniref:acyltransferase family protein n=1 Tax=Ciceribacter sp. sgz301302 TaxID=3342379 RepID=UPI0035B8F156
MFFRIIEFWRLLAALLVMAYHFLRYGPGDQFEASHTLERLLPLMDMFFIISGFLILYRYGDTVLNWRGYRSFLVKRLARFYPLYLVTFGFFVAVGIAVHLNLVPTTQPERYDVDLLLQNLLLLQAWGTTEHLSFNYVTWSLSAEWFCYLLLPLYAFAIRIGGMKALAGLIAVSIVALEAATRAGIIPFESWLKADTFGAYRAFVDFAIGGIIMLLVRDAGITLRSHLWAWAGFALTATAMLMAWPSYLVLAILSVSILLAAVVEKNNPDGARFLAPLSPVGRVSFGIYMWHPVVETVMLAVVWRFLVEPLGVIGFYQFWFVPMALSVLVAYLSDRYFEKPVGDRLTQIVGGRRRPAAAAAVPVS